MKWKKKNEVSNEFLTNIRDERNLKSLYLRTVEYSIHCIWF